MNISAAFINLVTRTGDTRSSEEHHMRILFDLVLFSGFCMLLCPLGRLSISMYRSRKCVQFSPENTHKSYLETLIIVIVYIFFLKTRAFYLRFFSILFLIDQIA